MTPPRRREPGKPSDRTSVESPPRPLPGRSFRIQRLHWKVERLPPEIRQLIFDGFASGKSYGQIREEVLARGERISRNALSKYWRHCWSAEHNELQRARIQAEILAHQGHEPGRGDLTALARELLWLNFVQRRQELQDTDLMALLEAAREQEKVHIAAHKAGLQAEGRSGRGLKDAPARAPDRTELRRRLRQIYGWPDEELEPADSPASHDPVS